MAFPLSTKKRTEHINFGKALDGLPADIRKISHEVTRRRQGIEEALNHIDDSSETIVNYLHEYLAVKDTLESIKKKAKSSSRMRFKWTNFLSEEKVASEEVEFDIASMMMASGLWHILHANECNQVDGEDESKMKEALNSLKTAAGIFECLKSLGHVSRGNRDIETSTIRALHLQCLAEAQCVTIRRAMSKGHKASLISELCADVAEKYSSASQQPDESHHLDHKWATYLKFQAETYLALTRCYQGVHLLEAEEQCGDSISVLTESEKHIQQALSHSKDYDKIKPKSKTSLCESTSFVSVRKLINEKKAKSDRENSMIYHQRIPEDCPPLPEAKCLIHATSFKIPEGQDLTLSPPTEEEETETSTTTPAGDAAESEEGKNE